MNKFLIAVLLTASAEWEEISQVFDGSD